MKTYKTLIELARTTRCHFAQKTAHGWVPCQSDRNSTHRFVYAIARQPSARLRPQKNMDLPGLNQSG